MLKRPKPKPLPRVLRVLGHHLLRLWCVSLSLLLSLVSPSSHTHARVGPPSLFHPDST